MRNTGIDIIGSVPWGTHFCQFYQDKQDLHDLLVPYFAAGLAQGEFCIWIASEPLDVEEMKAALEQRIPDLEEYIRSGQLEILDYSQWYTLSGKFDTNRVLQGWLEKLAVAQQRGFAGLRLAENTSCVEQSAWKDFAQYETEMNDLLGRSPMLAFCTYSLIRCGALEVLEVMSNHAFALIKRGDSWQIIESAERKKVAESLRLSEERYHRLFNSMQEAYALHEIICDSAGNPIDYRFLDINPAFERLTGLKREQLLNKRVLEVLPDLDPSWIETYGHVALTGEPTMIERYATPLQRYYQIVVFSPQWGQFVVIFSDITERKRAEEALRDSEQHYRLLHETMLQGVVYQDANGKITSMNPAAIRILGKFPESFLGETSETIEHHTIREDGSPFPGQEHPAMVALRSGQEVRGVVMGVYSPREQGYRWINISAVPLFRDGEAKPYQVYTLFDDITERRQAMEALLKSEARERVRLEEMEKILDAVPVAVWITHDPKALYISGNRLAYEWLNLPQGANISKSVPEGERPETFRMFKDGVELQAEEMPVQRSAAGEELRGYEFSFLYPDGGVRHILGNATPLRDEHGNLRGSISAFMDITERKKSEQALRESEERLSLVIQAAQIGTWDWNIITGELVWSERSLALFGIPSDMKMSYERFLEAIHPEDREIAEQTIRTALERHQDFYAEVRTIWPDGSLHWVISRGRGYYDEAGRLYG